MTELVSLATSIAACLSAVAALVVVRQNYKQRISSYKPEFVFVKTLAEFSSLNETGDLPHLADDTESKGVSIGCGSFASAVRRGRWGSATSMARAT